MHKRREFIKQTSLITGSALVDPLGMTKKRSGFRGEILRIGLVGCGGRGTGAAAQALMADHNTELVAMGDLFDDHLLKSYGALKEIDEVADRVRVPDEHKYIGFDAYQSVIRNCDVLLLATPPGFRPEHFAYAIDEGKHVFMEKPLSCDGPGTRKILAAGKKATENNLKVVVGLQNRYNPAYQEMVKKLQKGIIGDIVSCSCYYLKGNYALIPRSEVGSELEYQIKNWHFFNWMWAGAPGGLQIHNTDIVHWVKGSYPISVQGLGGRISLSDPGTGDSYDHFFLEYSYADGTKLYSQIRTIDHTFRKNGAWFTGTKGTANLREGIKNYRGQVLWKPDESSAGNAYQLEHDRFFEAIRSDTPHNDTKFGAFSSHAANMGRMAGESGTVINWEDALHSDIQLAPQITGWDQVPPIVPDNQGYYPFPQQHDPVIASTG